MKFTQTQLLDALKAKLTENGKHLSISEKTLQTQSDNLYALLVNEETELNDIVGKILPQFVTLNGNYEKDNADFIKKWQDEHKAPPTPNQKPTDPNPQSNKEMEALMERLKKLEEANAAIETEKLVAQKRSELLAKFKEKGIKDKKWTDKYLSKISVTKETDVEKETTDAVDFYNLSHAAGGGNITPGSGGGGGTGEIKKDHWKGILDGILPSENNAQ